MAILLKRNRSAVAFLLLFVPLLLSGCSSAVKTPLPLEQFATQAAVIPTQEYLIQPGDQLDIKFFYNPELNEQITVRPDGRIALQLAGEIKTAGLTPAQLTTFLTKTYSAELNNPKITVIVRTFNSQRVYVDGEVNRPGLIVLLAPTTALQSIAQAGGLKDTARSDEVILIRRGTDNRVMSTMLNLDKAIDGTDATQDVPLVPYDVVYVPKSHIANVDVWVDQYIRRLIPIPFALPAL